MAARWPRPHLFLWIGLCAASALSIPGSAEPPQDTLASGIDLPARMATTDSLYESARFAEALRSAEEGLALARAIEANDETGVASWLLRLGKTQVKLLRLAQAETTLAEALERSERGDTGSEVLSLQIWRAWRWLKSEQVDMEATLAAAKRCAEIAEEVHGEEDSETWVDRAALANVLLQMDRVEEAESLLRAAEEALRAPTDRDSDKLASVLTILASLSRRKGQFDAAISLLEEAVAITEQQSGKDHPAVAHPLIELAETYQVQGNLGRAEENLRRALSILEETYGDEHPRLGLALNNLGVLLRRKGDYQGSREAYRRSLASRIASYGEDHGVVALTMINYSSLLQSLGAHAESIRLLQRAVSIMERTYGPEHSRTAWALSHLAQAERRIGSSREAEQVFRRCLRIAEKTGGAEQIDIALYQVGIAQSIRDQGRLEEALVLFEQATAVAGGILGADSHEVARYRREVGVTLALLGRFEQARAVLEECVRTFERDLGPDHPALNRCLAGLTLIDLQDGRLEEADQSASRNLAAAERAFGERGLRRSLLMRLAVEIAKEDWGAALELALRAARIASATQEDIYQVSSDLDVLQYAVHHRRVIGALLAACVSTPTLPDSIKNEVFSLVAGHHGQVLDRFARRRQLVELGTDSTIARSLYEDYLAANELLAEQVLGGPRGDPDRFQARVAAARLDKEEAEKRLAEASERFRAHFHQDAGGSPIHSESIAALLGEDATLLQFVRYPSFSVGTAHWRSSATSLDEALFSGASERYGVFLLRAAQGESARLELIDLGDADSVDVLVKEYRRVVTKIRPGSRPNARDEVEFRAVSRELCRAIWDPLEIEAEAMDDGRGVGLVYVVPTSALHLVDFGTLLSSGGDLLIKRFRFQLLSSVRALQPRDRDGSDRSGLLVLGDPVQDEGMTVCEQAVGADQRLPGAEEEAEEVARQFSNATSEKVTLLLGSNATEAAFKSGITDVRWLHVAAHGFFCGDNPLTSGAGEQIGTDPLLRCGIILSPDPGEDGVLTAQEIVARDLRGLECVVLSACSSGLGELVLGEGLFGLRRAFQIAGTQTVVMAIWRVNDVATRDLMSRVYQNRLNGRSLGESLRFAQLERLNDQERIYHRIHPALWGGLVVEGDPQGGRTVD